MQPGAARGYLVTLGLVAVSAALLGAAEVSLGFVAVYLATYLSYGFVEPMHVELLNEAGGRGSRHAHLRRVAAAQAGRSWRT